MKHFSKLMFVIVASLALGLGFAGCAGESEAEKESIEVEEISTSSVDTTTLTSKISAEEKSIVFNGKTYASNEAFLWSEEGIAFQHTALQAAIAYMRKDTDELLKYFTDDQDKIKELFNDMENISYRYDQLYHMNLQVDIESYDNVISAWYLVLFSDMDSADYVSMYCYLQDEVWKIEAIYYTK